MCESNTYLHKTQGLGYIPVPLLLPSISDDHLFVGTLSLKKLQEYANANAANIPRL